MIATMHILAVTFPPEAVKHAINAITKPEYFISLSIIIFALMFILYKQWTRPAVFGAIFALFCIFYFGSIADENFKAIVTKPDNDPITIMVVSVMICIWIGF